ncbi:hypothetical protein T07_11901 [Trichinella nelsoni]|uniref:Uncharacterized protein n=1 Tax=Trichinella nelsoni TaxID=6336 RepID=A0A0V0RKV6_9BILA|nr:hypothetical protein T07_11901 [Trichinella nelsoni]
MLILLNCRFKLSAKVDSKDISGTSRTRNLTNYNKQLSNKNVSWAVLSLTGVQRAEMKGLFTLGSRCANRSHRQCHSNMNITAKRGMSKLKVRDYAYCILVHGISLVQKCRMPTLNLMNQNVKTCMGKSFQYFFRILFHHYPILNVMTLLGSSSCSYSSASNISSVPLMKKKFSHPLMEFQNSIEQPSGSNRTMNAKCVEVQASRKCGSDWQCPLRVYLPVVLLKRKVDYEKMIKVYFALNFEEQLDHEILYRFYTFAKSDTIVYAKKSSAIFCTFEYDSGE